MHTAAHKNARPEAHPPSSRRVLVTGGAGFIGSHLTDLLLSRGDHVTVVDNLSTGRRSNLPAQHPRLTFIHSDLDAALPTLPAFDQIYHLAAAVGVKLVMDDPIAAIETNIVQTAALLRFSAAHNTPTLIASSSEVYGKSAKSPFREEDDALYGPTHALRWSYAATKAVDEYLALAYFRDRGLPVTIARFFNTVGPRQVGDYGMVLPRFVAAALAGTPLEIFGDGSQERCFCDVRDVVEVLPRMLTAACFGRVFNVGSDAPISIRSLASHVLRVTGSGSPVVTVPYEDAYAPGFEDLKRRQPDVSRLKSAVGFSPTRTLEVTIRDVADAFSPVPREAAR